jgi:hypothetical protein
VSEAAALFPPFVADSLKAAQEVVMLESMAQPFFSNVVHSWLVAPVLALSADKRVVALNVIFGATPPPLPPALNSK